MLTDNKVGSFTQRRKYTYLPSNSVLFDNTRTAAYTAQLSEDRTPCTGKFIPNVYRITSHTAYRESLAVNRAEYWHDEAIDAGVYECQDTLDGDIGHFLYSRAKPLVPSISSGFGNYPQRVLLRAMGKLSEVEAGLGETLGEIKETLEMLRSPFKSFRDFLYNQNYRNLGLWQSIFQYSNTGRWSERGGRKLNGLAAAKTAANTWLEFRYGLMPLVYTIQDLIELANKQVSKLDQSQIRSVRSRLKVEAPIKFSVNTYYGATIQNTELFCNVDGVDYTTHRAVVHYHLIGVPTLAELLGLSPQALPELAWELTRLSFVVDWWLGIGDWLGAMRFNPYVHYLGNTVSQRVSRRVSTDVVTACAGISRAPRTPRGKYTSYLRNHYSRSINQSLPSIPPLKLEFKSYFHLLDSLALVINPALRKLSQLRRK